jgi:hypothetical protein
MGLLAWFGHQMYQPLWRERRYHTSCRKCGTRIKPTTQERVAGVLFMSAGVSIAVGARLMLPVPRPPVLLFALAGLFVGELVQYFFARYTRVDPVASELPTVRTVDTGKR